MYAVRAYKILKTYDRRKFLTNEPQRKVLDNISVDIIEKEFLGIMGESGCGKTTLLKILETIDKPTSGTIECFGFDLKKLSNENVAKIRRQRIGFVFQDYTLSGGEKQRIAIMRALMNNPDLILADEPTGNLDSSSALKVMDILKNINKRYGKTIVVVTHDINVAQNCKRVITINNGSIDGSPLDNE